MKSTSKVNLLFQKFQQMVLTQYNSQIQLLPSDNKGEFKSFEVQHYLEVYGIIHQTNVTSLFRYVPLTGMRPKDEQSNDLKRG